MFEINHYMLNKMGWTTYSLSRGINGHPGLFYYDNLVRFFIDVKSTNILYIVKELSNNEKQNTKKLYNFIKVDYKNYDSPKFEKYIFNSNSELFRLIIDNVSCNLQYQRHFKLNKIIK